MNDDELLKKLGALIGQTLDAKLEPLKKQLDTVAMKVEALNTKIDKVQESVDIIQGVMVEHNSALVKRVELMEDTLEIPRPKRN